MTNKQTISKNNKTKNWFFKTFNKIDKPSLRLTHKKRKRQKNTNISNKTNDVITNFAGTIKIIILQKRRENPPKT